MLTWYARMQREPAASGLSTLLMQNAVVETYAPYFNPSTPIPFHPSRGNGSIRAMRYRKCNLRRCRVCLLGEGVSERNELAYKNFVNKQVKEKLTRDQAPEC